jgi:hypothetical protein
MKANTLLIALALLTYWLGLSNASAFYDPGTQRWLNRDPLGDLEQEKALVQAIARLEVNMQHSAPPFEVSEGADLYEFAGNSPVRFYDSLGLHWSFACASIEKMMEDAFLRYSIYLAAGDMHNATVELRQVAILAQSYHDNGCDDPPPPPPMPTCPVQPPRWPPPNSPGPAQKCAWTLVGVGLGGVLEYGWVCLFAL